MCGITGLLLREAAVDRALLARMNNAIRHRGPDSDGFFTAGPVGLAMRRLAIIDVGGGNQPMFNEDSTVALVFNGEIYNYQDLRPELERAGHTFRTNSDTEVIVHGYEEWGDDVLLRIEGMFAIALWDVRRARLLLARDRMGEKPLYWHYGPHGLAWGSEAKCLLQLPWVSREVNPIALHHYLTLQYTPDPLTIFADINQLPAAHKLVASLTSPPVIERYWQLHFLPKYTLTDAQAIEEARALLHRVVQRQLVSEVPLGAFLSGGLDSSIIVALMAECASHPVKTFSIGFEESQFSETRYARLIAERYATDHHEFTFRPTDLQRVVSGVAAAHDEPFADPAALPLFELARQTRQHVTVALSGDGGDETLAGYTRYTLDHALRGYARLPRFVTQRLLPAAAALIPEPTWLPEDRNPITGLKRLGQASAVSHKASLVRWGSYFNHDEKIALYSGESRAALADVHTADWVAAAYDAAHAHSTLDRTLAADHATYLAGDLLPKTDRATMAHSVEARAPFLDVAWVEWTARLPERYKVRGRQTKWLLKQALADKLPQEITARGKQGFGVPVGAWLRKELRSWAAERLVHNSALHTWFRPEAIQHLFDAHQNGTRNHGKQLWALVMFAEWLDQKCHI